MLQFIKKHFAVEGTEFKSKNIYPELAAKTLCFAVSETFDVLDYTSKYGLTLHRVQQLKGEDKIVSYKAVKDDHIFTFTLRYLNDLPCTVEITAEYNWK